jgi:hypothetical protein
VVGCRRKVSPEGVVDSIRRPSKSGRWQEVQWRSLHCESILSKSNETRANDRKELCVPLNVVLRIMFRNDPASRISLMKNMMFDKSGPRPEPIEMRGASTPEKHNVNQPTPTLGSDLQTNRMWSENPGEKDPRTNSVRKLQAKTKHGTSIDSVRMDGIQPGSQTPNSVKISIRKAFLNNISIVKETVIPNVVPTDISNHEKQ